MKHKQKIGYRIAVGSILLNIALFLIKYIAGIETGSIAVMADAWHSLSDSFTSVIVIVGFYIASRPPDNEHPYGHGRAESIASIVIATILGIVAFDFIIQSWERLAEKTSVDYGMIAVYAMIISIVSKEAIAQVSIRMGKKYNSESLIADGWHHRTDSISSVLILIGAIFNIFWWFDGVMGICVGLLILWATYSIMKSAIRTIMGERPEPGLIISVKDIVHEVDARIEDIHNIKLHSYGDHREMTFDFRLPPDMQVDDAHEIAEIAGKKIHKKLKIKATVHVEPFIAHDPNPEDEV